ncbi:MAG: hypothetical protein J2P36_03920 [Ktedonobacteraceae bacterium]|nr:hypothetical protein [Ktedonobacteraceae bacterium]
MEVQKPEPEKTYPALRKQVEAAYDQIADRYAALTSAMPARAAELGTHFLSHLPPQCECWMSGVALAIIWPGWKPRVFTSQALISPTKC